MCEAGASFAPLRKNAWLIGTQSAAAASSRQPSSRNIRPSNPPRPTIGQRQRPARPNRTSGTRPTGISLTTIFAAGAVLEPINTIRARQPKARRPAVPPAPQPDLNHRPT